MQITLTAAMVKINIMETKQCPSGLAGCQLLSLGSDGRPVGIREALRTSPWGIFSFK